MANNTLTLTAQIDDVIFGFDPKQTYEFEEIPYPFNEENENIRAIYGDDFRG